MVLDEFGREIPIGRGPRSRSHYGHEDPSYLNGALPTGRHDDRGGGGGGGSGGPSTYHGHHHSQQHQHHHQGSSSGGGSSRSYHHDRHHHRGGGGGGFGGGGFGGGGGIPSDDNRSIRKRKQRDDSPDRPSSSTGRRMGGNNTHHTNYGGSSSSSSNHNNNSNHNKTPHPFTLYVDEPMLCEYLWKEKEASSSSSPDHEDHEDQQRGYEEYRQGFCLNYIRKFFNQHLDDSWFRSLYSPLEQYRTALLERNRAREEAQAFVRELQTSIDTNIGSSTKCFFILKARLGGGTKQANSSSSNNNNCGSDYFSPGKMSSSSISNPPPMTHLMSLSNHLLPIEEVPPHVSDQQLVTALVSYVKGLKRGDIQIYSTSVVGNGNLYRTAYIQCSEMIRKDILQQLNHTNNATASSTTNNTAEGGTAAHVPRKEDTYMPTSLELEVECSDAYGRMEVDVDGKGGGGGASSNGGGGGGADGGDEEAVVTPRKATVFVLTQTTTLPFAKPNIAVLSAAVSSKVHLLKDCEAAMTLARAYDIRTNIPSEFGFDTVLKIASPNFSLENADELDIEDTLDLAVAYLRRVHLLSFYNFCAKCHRVGDVWNGNHPSSTIHLRLSGADDILREAERDDPSSSSDEPPKIDLLVQRHTASIEKAMKEANDWLNDADYWRGIIVSPKLDSTAQRIEHEESQVEARWIRDHSVIDEDGRARCGFHFCRKLFKDAIFLKKHLLKKHSEHLKAERAKCHDHSMMEAWDAQENRPVPPILVDCGRAFSLVPSNVIGADIPLAEDPEPELWKRQEERREEEERIRKEREERFEPPDPNHNNLNSTGVGGAPSLSSSSNDRGNMGGGAMPMMTPRKSHFVDVDDMKEEKIDLTFDDVTLPLQPPKKKKKKKLL